MTTIYDYNDTMEILGYSKISGIIGGGGVACDNFLDVCRAHLAAKKNNIYDVGIDFFALGYIYGKKAERAERAGHEITPLEPANKSKIVQFTGRGTA